MIQYNITLVSTTGSITVLSWVVSSIHTLVCFLGWFFWSANGLGVWWFWGLVPRKWREDVMPQLGTQNFSSQTTRPQISKFTTKNRWFWSAWKIPWDSCWNVWSSQVDTQSMLCFFFPGTFFRNRLVARITSQSPFFKFAGLSSSKKLHHHFWNWWRASRTSRGVGRCAWSCCCCCCCCCSCCCCCCCCCWFFLLLPIGFTIEWNHNWIYTPVL